MPINAGAKPAITIGGTTNVKIVSWDSTASIPAGTSAIGAVSIIAGTATQNVLVVAQPIGISGTVTGIVAASGTQNVIVVGASTTQAVTVVNTAGPFTVSGTVSALLAATTADTFAIPTGGSIRYNGTSTNVNQLWLTITTSAAVIVVTSAANKVHIITSLWMNGNTSAAFKWQSATTDIGTLFIATSGVGMVLNHNDHGWHRTTASQSLVASAAVSGSYSGWVGYITISG